MLTPSELQRYARQTLLPEIGPAGQARLKRARVLCIGAGGLGSPVLLYCAAAGVGTIGIADGDVLDLTNLHRQVVHSTADLGRNKAVSAAAHLSALNPEITVTAIAQRVDATNLPALVGEYDLVLDGSDNFPTRFLVNNACFFAKVPLIAASVVQFGGYLTTFSFAPGTPCYRCLYPGVPAAGSSLSCAEAGILGAVAGVLGTLQATAALKWILGIGASGVGQLQTYDALHNRFDTKVLTPDPACPLCGPQPTITTLALESTPVCETP